MPVSEETEGGEEEEETDEEGAGHCSVTFCWESWVCSSAYSEKRMKTGSSARPSTVSATSLISRSFQGKLVPSRSAVIAWTPRLVRISSFFFSPSSAEFSRIKTNVGRDRTFNAS